MSGGHNTLNVNIHVMSTLARAVCDFALRVLSRFSGEEFRVEQRNGSFGCIPLGVGFVSSTCHICHSCNSRTSYPISHFYKVSLSLSTATTVFHIISEFLIGTSRHQQVKDLHKPCQSTDVSFP